MSCVIEKRGKSVFVTMGMDTIDEMLASSMPSKNVGAFLFNDGSVEVMPVHKLNDSKLYYVGVTQPDGSRLSFIYTASKSHLTRLKRSAEKSIEHSCTVKLKVSDVSENFIVSECVESAEQITAFPMGRIAVSSPILRK